MRLLAYPAVVASLVFLCCTPLPAAATPLLQGFFTDNDQGQNFSRRCAYDSDATGCTAANTPPWAVDGDDFTDPQSGDGNSCVVSPGGCGTEDPPPNTNDPGGNFCLFNPNVVGCIGDPLPNTNDPGDPPGTQTNVCLLDPAACDNGDPSDPPDPPDPPDTQIIGNSDPVTPIPEPPSWILLLTGLLAVSGCLLGRKSVC